MGFCPWVIFKPQRSLIHQPKELKQSKFRNRAKGAFWNQPSFEGLRKQQEHLPPGRKRTKPKILKQIGILWSFYFSQYTEIMTCKRTVGLS